MLKLSSCHRDAVVLNLPTVLQKRKNVECKTEIIMRLCVDTGNENAPLRTNEYWAVVVNNFAMLSGYTG